MTLADQKAEIGTIGVKQTAKAVRRGTVKEIYVASDCDEGLVAELLELCEAEGIPCKRAHTMAELGKVAGIKVGAAAIGFRR